jgi:MYXO-CTERM domain-containing protein
MKALLRRSLVAVVGSVTLLFASTAFAEGEACYNDDDCPGGGLTCGGDVCNWTKSNPNPDGMKAFTCNPAGSQTPVGKDGWCTTDDDCKCKSLGAKCVAPYCTFTKPSDAPAGSGGSGAGGSSGTAGTTSTAGTGTAGTGTAGTGTAGTGTGTAGTGPASGGGSSDSGGCSVGGATSTGAGMALALGALGLGVAFARRRR